MKPPASAEPLAVFLKSFDRYTTLSLATLLAIPFVLDLLFSLEPPWPRSSTYATAFLELSTLFLSFFVPLRSRRALFKTQLATFAGIVVAFIVYFAGYSLFVFDTPLTGERVISGYQCTEQARTLIAPLLMQTCPFLDESALAAAQYDVETVWTPLSVRVTEFVLFGAWSGFFILSTFLFGVSIAFSQRSEANRRRGATDPPNTQAPQPTSTRRRAFTPR